VVLCIGLSDLREQEMRSRPRTAASPVPQSKQWLEIEELAKIEVSSEDPNFPIESALSAGAGQGWRAAERGSQIGQRIRNFGHVADGIMPESRRQPELLMPCHPSLEGSLDAYISAAAIAGYSKGRLFRSTHMVDKLMDKSNP
jgi:hypothetical protein